jgi:hypothetical protein
VTAVGTRCTLAVALTLALLVAGCSSGSSHSGGSTTTTASKRTTTTTSTGSAAGPVCGNPGSAPARYRSVVVFSFENRTWSDVGLGFGPAMPYLHGLGQQCSYFEDWTETDPAQNSLTQYVGQVTGARQPGTVNDCSPSATCSTRADNLFRQLRDDGRKAVNYVEGATAPCSADHNAVRHVPALYLWGDGDRQACAAQVRPLDQLDVNALPSFAFITPGLCNDGHDCGNQVVDRWASEHVQPVLDSAAYRRGQVAVFIWYDEDHPVPNLWMTPTAVPGPLQVSGAGASATLRAWQAMLGVPCLADACSAPDLRGPAHS